MIPSLIAAGGSIVGNLLGFGSNESTNKANMRLAEYQYDRNLEMWNLANEYNKPANQVKRLRDAGLNPALLYGSGSVANTSQSIPQYNAPHLQSYQGFGDLGMGQAVTVYQNARNLDSQIRKTDAETENILTNKSLTELEAGLKEINLLKEQYMYAHGDEKGYWRSMLDLRKRELSSNISNREADTSLKGKMSLESESRAALNLANEQLVRNKNVTETLTRGQIRAMTSKLYSDIQRNEVLNSLTPYQIASLTAGVVEAGARTRNYNATSRRTAIESAIRERLLDEGIDLNSKGIWGSGISSDKITYAIQKAYEEVSEYFKSRK